MGRKRTRPKKTNWGTVRTSKWKTLLKQVESLRKQGYYIRDSCDEVGIAPSTYWVWKQRKEAFKRE